MITNNIINRIHTSEKSFQFSRSIKILLLAVITLFTVSCNDDDPFLCDFPDGSRAYCAVQPIYMAYPVGPGEGPLYVSQENANNETQQLIDQGYPIKEFNDFNNAGKIYTFENLLLVNDRYNGVYFFDNTDPEAPKHLLFFEATGATDMVINDGYVYINNFSDLLSFELANPSNWARTKNVLAYAFDENSLPLNLRFAELEINISKRTRTEIPIIIDPDQGILIGYLNSDGKEFFFSDSAL